MKTVRGRRILYRQALPEGLQLWLTGTFVYSEIPQDQDVFHVLHDLGVRHTARDAQPSSNVPALFADSRRSVVCNLILS